MPKRWWRAAVIIVVLVALGCRGRVGRGAARRFEASVGVGVWEVGRGVMEDGPRVRASGRWSVGRVIPLGSHGSGYRRYSPWSCPRFSYSPRSDDIDRSPPVDLQTRSSCVDVVGNKATMVSSGVKTRTDGTVVREVTARTNQVHFG